MTDWNAQNSGLSPIAETLTFDSCPYTPPDPNAANANAAQQIALASYIHPLADPDAWNRIVSYNNDKITVLVANILNGPDSMVNSNWKTVIDRAIAGGKTVIAYVRTGYLGVSQQQFTTRLGSINLADWVDQIEQDVEKWYELYGDGIGGIFFDEGWNDCGPDNVYADLYAYINRNTKRKQPGAFTVLNPGATMPQCFEGTMDTLMTFESSYEQYTTNYVPNDWMPSDPRKIWHIIYNVPQNEVAHIAKLAQERGAGLVEITNDNLTNPYNTLPDDVYMQTLMNAIEGGSPRATNAMPLPPGSAGEPPSSLQVTSADYSSVGLSWSAAANAVGYRVYLNGKSILDLPSTMTRVTVGMLDPGTSGYAFRVAAVGGSGTESASTGTVTSDTMPLPDGKPMINLSSSLSDGDAIYQADVLIPYVFVRIYFCCAWQGHCGSLAAWPVQYNREAQVWCPYLGEGTTLYKYSGPPQSGGNIPWSWTPITEGQRDVTGYTYKWTLPQQNETVADFVIQSQGYGPLTNVLSPCPGLSGGPDGYGRYCA